MVSSLNIVVQFIFHLACMLFLIRFLLQASQADFYNPISQAVVKGTDPVCKPLRSIIKPMGGLDLASILVAWLVAVSSIYALVYINQGGIASPALTVLWLGLVKMLLVLTQFYRYTLLIVIIASFLVQGSPHPALQLLQQLLEPLLAPIRRVMPNFGPIDLSPMLLILVIYLVENIISQMVPRGLG
ncbi:MAG: YggT family protein [Pseudomonadota bacterium]